LADEHPYEVIEVLSNIRGDAAFAMLLELSKSKEAGVRKAAVAKMPNVTAIGAKQLLPRLLELLDDTDEDVRKAAMFKISTVGSRVRSTEPELQKLIKEKIIPRLLADAKSGSCYATLSIADFGENARAIIPELVELLSEKRNYCVQNALFKLGPEGQKYLTKDQIEEFRNLENLTDFDLSPKIEPIEPKKEAPVKKAIPTDG